MSDDRSSRARTFFEKVWTEHVIADLGDDTALLQIDRLFLHDQATAALRKLRLSGRSPASASQAFAVVDHAIATTPGRGADESPCSGGTELIRALADASREYAFTFFGGADPRQGIVHVVSPEQGIALPGLTLVCADSHTCTVGGIGSLAWGIGASDGAHVLATQTLAQVKPRTMRVLFDGRLSSGVAPKDMVLHLIGIVGADGGTGYAVEYAGSAVRSLPIEGRLTLCNMTIEFSAKYGFVAPDDTTIHYVAGRPYAPTGVEWDRAVAHWKTLPSDPDVQFDREVQVDCSRLSPQVTWGTSPDQVVPVDGHVPASSGVGDLGMRALHQRALDYIQLTPGTALQDVPIDAAYIGSCTNSRLDDLRSAAAVLRGRRVARHVRAICVPGSTAVKRAAESEGLDEVFRAAGFEWHESGCGLCSADGRLDFANQRVISTTNRNFEGRQGPRTRTHLASPATVAASAVTGRIADVRRMLT
jgi:3-isopropylmalate/(R)-2-methylmalate dehydratase large subunit